MSNIAIFTFENQTVRTALKSNEPYFCLADVSEILSLQSRATSTFNLDEKGIEKIQITDSLNRKQTATFINEPNLYRVIFRSNKAEAVKFQNWVFDEVLPSIRKTGQYTAPTPKLSDEQCYQIQKAIKQKCLHNGVHYQTIYNALYDKFKKKSYKDILATDFDEAMAFIESFEFAPALSLNIPFIQNVLADNAYQNRKAQDELSQMMAYFSGALDHLQELKHRLEISERCIMALQNRFIA